MCMTFRLAFAQSAAYTKRYLQEKNKMKLEQKRYWVKREYELKDTHVITKYKDLRKTKYRYKYFLMWGNLVRTKLQSLSCVQNKQL